MSVLNHLMQPGSSLNLLPIINFAIVALLVVLGTVVVQELQIAIGHVVVMGTLALCLLISVNWLVTAIMYARVTFRLLCNGFPN